MPLVSIKCPHCEAAIQLQVTSVARSRPCPVCKTQLMLQVAERASGVKRKALLVGETVVSDSATPMTPSPAPIKKAPVSNPVPASAAPAPVKAAAPAPSPATKPLPAKPVPAEPKVDLYQQRAFKGHAYDRMRADPELMRAKKRLVYGAATVSALVLIATVWSLFANWNRMPGEPEPIAVPEVQMREPQEASVSLQKQAVAPIFSKQEDFAQIVKRRQAELGANFAGE